MRPFTQTELNETVLHVAEMAREVMIRDLDHPHLGIVIWPDRSTHPCDFLRMRDTVLKDNPALKDISQRQIWHVIGLGAKSTGAVAIIGVHDIRAKESTDPNDLKKTWKRGEIADNPNLPEFLLVIGKAPGTEPAACLMRYKRKPAFVKGEMHGEKIEFVHSKPELATGEWRVQSSLIPDFWDLEVLPGMRWPTL